MNKPYPAFNVSILYGHVEIVTTERREGYDLVAGGYSIIRDRDGKEVSRTRDEEACRLVGYFDPKCWR